MKRKLMLFCIAGLLIILFPLSIFSADSRRGPENEADFLAWYEAHKNIGGEYRLDGILKLSSGTSHNPIILDGTGKIKINSGRNGIWVDSPVIINNPNLEIVTQSYFGIIINGNDARLEPVSGSILANGKIGIYLQKGELISGNQKKKPKKASPSQPELRTEQREEVRFTIQVESNEMYQEEMGVYGIYSIFDEYNPRSTDLYLSGLEISVSGVHSYGIINQAGAVFLSDSDIRSYGDDIAYGVWARGKLQVSDSTVDAGGPVGAALYSRAGQVSYEEDNCTISDPDEELRAAWLVRKEAEKQPAIALEINKSIEDIPFLTRVDMEMVSPGSADKTIKPIEIETWDTSMIEFDQVGSYEAEGILSEDSLHRASASNAAQITAKQRVILLDKTGTFIDEIQFDKDMDVQEDGATLRIWSVKPEGAEALYVEYSRDGENWFRSEWEEGNDNWLLDWSTMEGYSEDGRILIIAEVPYRTGVLGIRLHTVGGGVYEGVGRASTVNLTTGAVSDVWNPGSSNDGSSGDRGGGSIVSPPGLEPAALKPNPEEAARPTGLNADENVQNRDSYKETEAGHQEQNFKKKAAERQGKTTEIIETAEIAETTEIIETTEAENTKQLEGQKEDPHKSETISMNPETELNHEAKSDIMVWLLIAVITLLGIFLACFRLIKFWTGKMKSRE